MKKNYATLVLLLMLISVKAQTTFSLDGIRYTTKTDSTVNLVSNSGLYTGNFTIPSIVLYSGVSYKVVSIVDRAFSDCTTLTSVSIPSSVKSIGAGAFFNCSRLATITIPSSVTSIGTEAFIGCTSIKTITIPSSITSIQTGTFSGCTALSSINLPSSITSIAGSTFFNCPGLTSINCMMNTPPSITSNVFTNVNFSTCKLYVPISSLNAYKNAIGWSSFSNIIESSPIGDIIYTDSVSIAKGTSFNIPIMTSGIQSAKSIIAYQFKMNYDTTKIEFVGYSKESTLSVNSTVNINQSPKGNLQIGCISSNSFSGIGTLLNLQFKAISTGEATPIISKFLLNIDTVSSISNGTISIFNQYGDIDNNDFIQAYDAALVLQYSVDLDPIPSIDPIPWTSSRIAAADVDNNGSITANDAGLILQKSIGLLSIFPTEQTSQSMLRSASIQTNPDVTISLENNNLVFKSFGNLIGLNVKISGATSALDKPQILNDDMISAINCNENSYSVGLATAITPEEGSTIMTIPVNSLTDTELRFDLIINTTEKVLRMSVPTGTISIDERAICIYTNHDRTIHVSNALGKSISIFDASGRKILEKQTLQDSGIFTVKTPGLYIVRVDNVSKKIMVN